MTAVATCPQCQLQLSVPDEADATSMVRCPVCRSTFELREIKLAPVLEMILVQRSPAEPPSEHEFPPAAADQAELDLVDEDFDDDIPAAASAVDDFTDDEDFWRRADELSAESSIAAAEAATDFGDSSESALESDEFDDDFSDQVEEDFCDQVEEEVEDELEDVTPLESGDPTEFDETTSDAPPVGFEEDYSVGELAAPPADFETEAASEPVEDELSGIEPDWLTESQATTVDDISELPSAAATEEAEVDAPPVETPVWPAAADELEEQTPAEAPLAEEFIAELPVAEELAVEEPAAEEFVAESPEKEEPAAGESASELPAAVPYEPVPYEEPAPYEPVAYAADEAAIGDEPEGYAEPPTAVVEPLAEESESPAAETEPVATEAEPPAAEAEMYANSLSAEDEPVPPADVPEQEPEEAVGEQLVAEEEEQVLVDAPSEYEPPDLAELQQEDTEYEYSEHYELEPGPVDYEEEPEPNEYEEAAETEPQVETPTQVDWPSEAVAYDEVAEPAAEPEQPAEEEVADRDEPEPQPVAERSRGGQIPLPGVDMPGRTDGGSWFRSWMILLAVVGLGSIVAGGGYAAWTWFSVSLRQGPLLAGTNPATTSESDDETDTPGVEPAGEQDDQTADANAERTGMLANYETPVDPKSDDAASDPTPPIDAQPELEPAPFPKPPAEPATPHRLVASAPSYSMTDLAAALEAAQEAVPGLVEGDMATHQAAKADSYGYLCLLAERLTYVVDDPTFENRTMLLLDSKDIFRRAAVQSQVRYDVAELASYWLSSPTRAAEGVNGIVVTGNLTDVRVRGSVYEYYLDGGAGDHFSFVMPERLDRQIYRKGEPLIAAGSIVEQPTEAIQGYTGSSARTILAASVKPLARPTDAPLDPRVSIFAPH